MTHSRVPSHSPLSSFSVEKHEEEPQACLRKDDQSILDEKVKIYEAKWEDLDEHLWKKVFQVLNEDTLF